MLRYIYGDELNQFPKLRDTMFRDRACQFKARLGWEVDVDATGQERDAYDDKNPLYVIWQRADGSHGGSMRFLPTVAETMVNDHFTHLTDGVEIRHPMIWECTRFCLAKGAETRVSAALMLDWLGQQHHEATCTEAGLRLETAVEEGYRSGAIQPIEQGGNQGTREVAAALCTLL